MYPMLSLTQTFHSMPRRVWYVVHQNSYALCDGRAATVGFLQVAVNLAGSKTVAKLSITAVRLGSSVCVCKSIS